jgi:D-tyrosyl-tRNA(Tyr) deacylase
MILVIQRVTSATVVAHVEGAPATRATIGPGLLVLVGILTTDTEADLAWCAAKIADLRIFEDAAGKMNLSVRDMRSTTDEQSMTKQPGSVMLVPNFTLAADAAKGRRPSFDRAMRPELAQPMFERLATLIAQHNIPVATGVFRAHMEVTLTNDGPITLIVQSPIATQPTEKTAATPPASSDRGGP